MSDPRRAEARRLRQETRMSLAQLRHHFGVSRDTMADWLWGLPTPEWTQGPNAKDDLRARAIELRRDGCSSTVRSNVGDSYRGCLAIGVLRSRPHYWRVEGIMRGIVSGMRQGGDATM
jgi:hypothetical protein